MMGYYGGIQCEYDGILRCDTVGYSVNMMGYYGGIQCEYGGILWWDTV